MAVYFIDSSALVKRYVNETGSSWVLSLFDPASNNRIVIAAITAVEMIAAISRRERGGSLAPLGAKTLCNQFRLDYQSDYQSVNITSAIVTSAMGLSETYGLRGYDAVQLAVGCAIHAVCLASGTSLTFVSSDGELNEAALREGIVVENPNSYP
ncbi:MAG: type II toxin-antitoxin system VapC family toxin [Lyngbya sp. HA4199-MV5]|jgi:hypothetical protein|nr:type II toxin-antitoxin system VapC family toxin [Lyngbya sp. HA4199-MV5]